MSNVNNGALPAFPSGESWKSIDCIGNTLERSKAPLFIGLTKREEIASRIMAGLCANPGGPIQANGMTGWGFANCTPDQAAGHAVDLADALIAALGNEVAP